MMATAKIRLGVSSCLLGEKVRFDGQHKRDAFLVETLGQFVEWVPVCPEVECGMSVPREAMRLVSRSGDVRLVTSQTNVDQTDRMRQWARQRLPDLARLDLSGFVFKSDSPSSGLKNVRVYDQNGVPHRGGTGIFAQEFTRWFPMLPVEDDGRLNDPSLRENFIERVFVYRRWQDLISSKPGIKDLVEFHARHKLLIMAHSPKDTRELGKRVASSKGVKFENLFDAYAQGLMAALSLLSTVKKNTNVLQHMVGYFKEQLSGDEKQELLHVVDEYHRQLIPLVVPIVLLQHYVRKYKEPYLSQQYYLYPHPEELMLRNHV